MNPDPNIAPPQPQQPIQASNVPVTPGYAPPQPTMPTPYGPSGAEGLAQAAQPSPAGVPQIPVGPQPAPATSVGGSYPPPAQPVPAAAPMGVSAPAYASSSGPNKLILGGVGLIVVAAAVAAYFVLRPKPITLTDVTNATLTANTMDSDLSDADLALTEITGATTTKDLTSELATLDSKITDAQTQYNTLQKSPVLANADTDKAFKAVAAKWQPYIAFLNYAHDDYQSLGPVSVQLETSIQAVTQGSPSTQAEYSAYLATLSSTLTTDEGQVASLHMMLAGDQQSVTALKTFLQASIVDVAKARTDLANNDMDATYTDLDNMGSASNTFSTSLDNATKALNDQQQSLDPSQQISNFLDAVAKISATAKT